MEKLNYKVLEGSGKSAYVTINVVDRLVERLSVSGNAHVAHGKKTQLQTQKSYKSVGTENVRTRLSLLCHGELKIEKNDTGTTATIRIPEEINQKQG